MTDVQGDPDEARERARAALTAALAAAARALTEGVSPEALVRYVEERMAVLRRAADGFDENEAGHDNSTRDGPSEDVPDRHDELG